MTTFQTRHLGSSNNEAAEMLAVLGFENREKFIEQVLPQSIRWKNKLTDPSPLSETEVLELLAQISRENRPGKCYIGQGYYNSTTPPVIRRNALGMGFDWLLRVSQIKKRKQFCTGCLRSDW